MRMAGIEVSGNDGRTLVDLLLRIGRDADLALAHRIERGFSRQVQLMALSPEEADLLLGVLDDPPEGGLSELRGALASH
jgi:hypothetical protein